MMEKMDDDEMAMEECGGLSGGSLEERGPGARIFTTKEKKLNAIEHGYVEPNYPRLPGKDPMEWQYAMRRTMQEIIPGIYLGPYASATKAKLEEMKAAGLTHVVCVRQGLEKNLVRPNHPEHFKYMVVEIADSMTENIIPHFSPVNEFLNECLLEGGKALIHGNAGISRSGALVIAFIMSRHGVTLKDAFKFVQSKRFCCNPNEGFMAQLREYEPIYRAQQTVPIPLPIEASDRIPLKRSLEVEEEEGNCKQSYPPTTRNAILSNTQSEEAMSCVYDLIFRQ